MVLNGYLLYGLLDEMTQPLVHAVMCPFTRITTSWTQRYVLMFLPGN